MDWALIAGGAAALACLSWWPPTAGRLKPREPAKPAGSWGRRGVSAAATGAAVAFAAAGLGWIAAALGLAAAVASYLVLGRLRAAPSAARERRLIADLPQACDLLAVCVDAGLPARAAVVAVVDAMDGPLAEALAGASAKVSLGVDEARAWGELGADPALSKLGRELRRGADAGVSLSARLVALGVDARRAAAAAVETAAKRVGVRSVMPLMICFLPSFILVGVVPIVGGMLTQLF